MGCLFSMCIPCERCGHPAHDCIFERRCRYFETVPVDKLENLRNYRTSIDFQRVREYVTPTRTESVFTPTSIEQGFSGKWYINSDEKRVEIPTGPPVERTRLIPQNKTPAGYANVYVAVEVG